MGTGKGKLRFHYRRLLEDYDGWELWIWIEGDPDGRTLALEPLMHTKSLSPYRDVFGSIFELDLGGDTSFPIDKTTKLGVQARWGEWHAQDSPERTVDVGKLINGDHDLFMIEGESAMFASMKDYQDRFISVNVSMAEQTDVWLTLFEGRERRKDVFPSDQRRDLFLLDTMNFTSSEIGIAAVIDHVIPKEPQLMWTASKGTNVTLELSEADKERLKGRQLSPEDTGHTKDKSLLVNFQRSRECSGTWHLTAWVPSAPAFKVRVKSSSRTSNAVLQFQMPLGKLFPAAEGDLCLRFEDADSQELSADFTWSPELGYDVFVVEGLEHPMSRIEEERALIYYRLSQTCDSTWHLEVSCDSWNQSTILVYGKVSQSRKSVIYDLGSVWFPSAAEISVRPVKLAKSTGKDTSVAASQPVMRDMWRKLRAKELSGKQYFVQGSVHFSRLRPSAEELEAKRYGTIYYRRFDDEMAGWSLWTWDSEDEQADRVAVPQQRSDLDKFAKFRFDRSKFGCGRHISIVGRQAKEGSTNRDEPARKWAYEDAAQAFPAKSFLLQGYPELVAELSDAVGKTVAHVDIAGSISVFYSISPNWYDDLNSPNDVRIESSDLKRKINVVHIERKSPTHRILHLDRGAVADEDFPVEDYSLRMKHFESSKLMWRKFDDWDKYYYGGSLGCEYTPGHCTFRVFAPSADSVAVVLYSHPIGENGKGSDRRAFPMRRIPDGCWKVKISGNLKGQYYKLFPEGKDERLFPGVEVIDPYSRCNTAHHTMGRGLIWPRCEGQVAGRPQTPARASVIYEMHIRDATIDTNSGVQKRGKFLGLTERGTAMPSKGSERLSTGLDHILEMGVNTLQIMPVQDFDNDETSEEYRWGYMPVHFNSPDGWYATNVHDFSRVEEFRKLVDVLHRNGIKVVMDVVYNHTSEDPNELNLLARFSFNGLAPRYYYRNCVSHPIAASGHNTCAWHGMNEPHCGTCYSNGSGCGNEFRSDAPMGRKFILDSLRYWVEEFNVDGFRFDLMGLIDQETMTQAAAMLKKMDPGILIYGEPWTGGPSPIIATVKGFQRSRQFGVFNDTLRDALRGNNWDLQGTFLMDGEDAGKVKRGMMGSIDEFVDSPEETINYAECHDNRTLWDQLDFYRGLRKDGIVFSDSDLQRAQRHAAVIVLTSQGIPFIQMGQEMCRTKGGVENSYESPDSVNMVRWEWKRQNLQSVAYYRGLIKLRLSHLDLFAMDSAEQIRRRFIFYEELGLVVPGRCIAYRILADNAGAGAWHAVVLLFNPTPMEQTFPLPKLEDPQFWIPVVDDIAAGTEPVGPAVVEVVGVRGRSAKVLRSSSPEEFNQFSAEFRANFVSAPFESSLCDSTIF